MLSRTKIEKLEELIKGSIDGQIIEQSLTPLLPPGENFGSVIYAVDFKVKSGEKIEAYHAVAKCTPPNKVTQELFNIQVTTKAEIAWYTTVIPTIREYLRKHGMEEADFFQPFYGARISLDPNSDIVDLDGVILTKNLRMLGYKNIDRHIGFDLKTSKAILKNLATFHAVPISIKMKNKEIFEQKVKPYLPSFKVLEDSPSKDKEEEFRDIENGLNVIPEILPFLDRVIIKLKEKTLCNSEAPEEPWSSVCHNDFWINNIMVKEESFPKVIILDFQIPAYESIAVDVLFFLLVSVNQEVIIKYMDELIQYYWDKFENNLKQLNIDSALFMHKGFLKEIDKAACSGRFRQIFFQIYVILMDKGYTHIDASNENFEKEDFKRNKFILNSRHKEKYKWLILEFVKRGWI